MRWMTLKAIDQIKLNGITITPDFIDKQLKGVRLTDKDGNHARFFIDSYNLYAAIPSAPEMKDVWRLHGTYRGKLTVDEQFDSEWAAQQRHRELDSDDALKIEKASVPAETEIKPSDPVPF